MKVAYYEAGFDEFRGAKIEAILGTLSLAHGFDLDQRQRDAWFQQIVVMKKALAAATNGHILFELKIPRMGKRADVVLVLEAVILVIEFKVGAVSFDRAAVEQVHDYALDLKNFHRGSRCAPIVPVLVATAAKSSAGHNLSWASDNVASPLLVSLNLLAEVIEISANCARGTPIDYAQWLGSGYEPTPTIIEAAQTLYRSHEVEEITRSEAGAINLKQTTSCITEVIERSKADHRRSICFVTGVPGAGKTLAGLNIATRRSREHSDEHAVFLSGNGPLVAVMREALARDECGREGISKKDALRRVSSFIQNIHHFRDDVLGDPSPPFEKVVVFDEAQRAWTREQTAKFMQTKRGQVHFEQSEPELLIGAMDRHENWCVVVCLVGGGQEINTGEAGLSEWFDALERCFGHWDVYVSGGLDETDLGITSPTSQVTVNSRAFIREELHLSVSMRSFRAEALSEFVGHIVENRPVDARNVYEKISDRYPFFLTRSLEEARDWLRQRARGSERFGLLASSGGYRLRPEGLHVKAKIDGPTWFLNDRDDIRSSLACEEVGTEFDVQGLELDWAGVCWDADFRYNKGDWDPHRFRGTRWQRVNAVERKIYLRNAYRVIMTRARQGVVIFIPRGSDIDETRRPEYYDGTFAHLKKCGLQELH